MNVNAMTIKCLEQSVRILELLSCIVLIQYQMQGYNIKVLSFLEWYICSFFNASFALLRKYAMNTIKCSPLLHANTMLINLFLSYHTPMFPWKNTAVFQYLPICSWHWKRSVLNTHRIRKYAYLFACSKSSVFEAYQCEHKAATARFCSVFIQLRSRVNRAAVIVAKNRLMSVGWNGKGVAVDHF